MAWVYILGGSSGRYYIGSCMDLDARFAQHLRGHTATTKRLGAKLAIVAKKEIAALEEARRIERALKCKKNPRPRHLLSATVEQVGSSNPPGTPYSFGVARYGTKS